jgi:hypothetical protein
MEECCVSGCVAAVSAVGCSTGTTLDKEVEVLLLVGETGASEGLRFNSASSRVCVLAPLLLWW